MINIYLHALLYTFLITTGLWALLIIYLMSDKNRMIWVAVLIWYWGLEFGLAFSITIYFMMWYIVECLQRLL